MVARAQAVLLGLVAEADARGALLGDGAPSSQAWLRARLRISPSEAASYVRTRPRGAGRVGRHRGGVRWRVGSAWGMRR